MGLPAAGAVGGSGGAEGGGGPGVGAIAARPGLASAGPPAGDVTDGGLSVGDVVGGVGVGGVGGGLITGSTAGLFTGFVTGLTTGAAPFVLLPPIEATPTPTPTVTRIATPASIALRPRLPAGPLAAAPAPASLAAPGAASTSARPVADGPEYDARAPETMRSGIAPLPLSKRWSREGGRAAEICASGRVGCASGP